jgi:homoserine acetyltransferase
MTDISRILRVVDLFAMKRGDSPPELQLAYATWVERNPADNNSVMLFTGLSPSARAAQLFQRQYLAG